MHAPFISVFPLLLTPSTFPLLLLFALPLFASRFAAFRVTRFRHSSHSFSPFRTVGSTFHVARFGLFALRVSPFRIVHFRRSRHAWPIFVSRVAIFRVVRYYLLHLTCHLSCLALPPLVSHISAHTARRNPKGERYQNQNV